MVELLLAPAALSPYSAAYRERPPLVCKAEVTASPWTYGSVGTGGVNAIELAVHHVGYAFPAVGGVVPPSAQPALQMQQMQQVKAGFGRTMSRLPEVFGVSRQTLYNWLKGETPKDTHLARLRELAEAGAFFTAMGFTPTSSALDRSLVKGKTFLQLLAQGENGKEMAKKLIRVHQRSESSRARLDAILDGEKSRPTAADFGAPALNEAV